MVPVSTLADLRSKGVLELWKNYEKRFIWSPNVIISGKPLLIWLNTYNGEKEFINCEDDNKIKVKPRAVVQKTNLIWKGNDDKTYSAVIDFNESEIFKAFEKLTNNATSQELKLQILVSEIDQVSLFR